MLIELLEAHVQYPAQKSPQPTGQAVAIYWQLPKGKWRERPLDGQAGEISEQDFVYCTSTNR